MAVPDSRKDAYLITSIIAIVAVIALCFASAFLFAGSNAELKNTSYTENEGVYEFSLVYDREMFGGVAEIEITDDAGAHDKFTIMIEKSGSDDHALTGKVTSEIKGGRLSMNDQNSAVVSMEQVWRFGAFAILIVPLTIIAVLVAVRGFTCSVKRYIDGEDEIVLCNGVVRHEMYVNGDLISESKTWIPFMSGYLGGVVNEKTMKVTVSPMNVPTLAINDRVIEEYNEESGSENTPQNDDAQLNNT